MTADGQSEGEPDRRCCASCLSCRSVCPAKRKKPQRESGPSRQDRPGVGSGEGDRPDLRSPEITKWQSETIETLEPQRDGANDQRQYHNAGEPRFDTARQRSRFGNKRRKNRSPHANKEAD